MLCIEKGQDRTKVLPSDALYPTCRASASNAVVTSRMLDESKCGVFKKSRRCWRTVISVVRPLNRTGAALGIYMVLGVLRTF